jgi:NAD(P)-dependent dehydrogenase (short-subunit alcohol dehydrogenase family)
MTRSVALVTGAGSGLGFAVVEHLRSLGWAVAGVDLKAGESPADLIFTADIADQSQVETTVAATIEKFGQLDAVVNCAGIFIDALTPVEVFSRTSWDRTIAVNLTACFLLARASLPHLKHTGGSIVFIASTAARVPSPGAGAYAASKAGAVALAKTIALEYGRFGVRSNAILPGYMNTPMAAPALSKTEVKTEIEARIPIGRVAEPQEVARLVGFLVSDSGRYLTGEEIAFDGAKSLTAFTEPADIDRMWRRAERIRSQVQ